MRLNVDGIGFQDLPKFASRVVVPSQCLIVKPQAHAQIQKLRMLGQEPLQVRARFLDVACGGEDDCPSILFEFRNAVLGIGARVRSLGMG